MERHAILFCLLIVLLMLACRVTLRIWTYFAGLSLIVISLLSLVSTTPLIVLWVLYGLFALVFNIKFLRARLFSRWLFARAKKNLLYTLQPDGEGTGIATLEEGVAQSVAQALGDFKFLMQLMGVNALAIKNQVENAGVKQDLAYVAANTYLLDAIFYDAIKRNEKPLVTPLMLKNQALKRLRKIAQQATGVRLIEMQDFLRAVTERQMLEKGSDLSEEAVFRSTVLHDHSYFFQELAAIKENNLQDFDAAIFSQFGKFIRNLLSGLSLSLSHGYLSNAPFTMTKRYFQRFDQFAYAFSLLVDFTLLFSMAEKKRETLLSELGDILGLLCLGSAFLNYLNQAEWDEKVLPLVDWMFQSLLFDTQTQILAVIKQFPSKSSAFIIKLLLFPYGPLLKKPSAALGEHVAKTALVKDEVREALLEIKEEVAHQVEAHSMEHYFDLFLRAELLEKRVERAFQQGDIAGEELIQQTTAAVAAGILSQEEADLLLEAQKIRETKFRDNDEKF